MRINEEIKVDVAYAATAVVTSMTTPYFSMDGYNRALFVWTICQVSPVATSVGTINQAVDASAATSATALASTTATLSANTKVTRFTVTPSASAQTSAITVTTYDPYGTANTALAYIGVPSLGTALYTLSSRYFAPNDTADGTAIISTMITNMAACMNDATYGLRDGGYASAASTTITIRGLDGGDTAFTFTSSNTTNFTVAVDEAMGMIEVEASSLSLSSSFTHVALVVTNSTSCHTNAYIIRGGRKRKNRAPVAGAVTYLGY